MNTLKSETRGFSAEIGKLLHLMINALYTNKDTCIRELISNASDACDKLRYLAQLDSSYSRQQPEPRITVRIDLNRKTLSIKDSGIGMNKDELLQDLGTVASSGTERFLAQMSNSSQENSLIGQFGVGFYSVFMIADRVEVKTRKAEEDQSYLWTSDGSEFFTITDSEERYNGTEIIAYIKESEGNYLDSDYVKNVILRYSNNIAVPIFLEKSCGDSEQVNAAKALWTLNKSEITPEQYKEFYQNVFYASDAPWKVLHNKNEGAGSFVNLLFIPTEKTFDLFSPERKRRVKLYVKRVFITEEGVDLIPYYLRFVRGVVDTDSLPLNISREMIQSSPVLVNIRRVIVARILKELRSSVESEEYKKFWLNFGAVLKEGLCEDASNAEAILDLCLFYSATRGCYITLSQYLENFTDNQKSIYYLTGESLQSLSGSPQIEGFLKCNVDVLFMTDTVDSFWLSMVSTYREIPFVSAASAGLDIPKTSLSDLKETEPQDSSEESEQLCHYFKECLGDLVQDVRVSKKLVNSPACLMTKDGFMDGRMERFLLAQNHIDKISPKIMEINFQHPIIEQINNKVRERNCDQSTKDLVLLLFDQILLITGEPVKDARAFCDRMNSLIVNKGNSIN